MIHLARGNYADAGISALAIVPFIGDLGKAGKYGAKVLNKTDDIYAGVKQASKYLKDQGVPRHNRKQILESFDVRTITVKKAGTNEFGLRYYDDINAQAKGRFLFDTFSASRNSLALPTEWNQMTKIKQWQIKEGATMFEGIAAPQQYYSGGRKQIFVPNLGDLF